ncbi:MAG: hypothetical protein JKY68_08240, partial [Rhodospirillales bacterium]|nr:hypothetical protein [Rhodospirillales bacterium]
MAVNIALTVSRWMLAGATATLTGGADTITGNGGADTINLGSGYADIVKYTATTDGAAAGANTGYDRISNFLSGTDKINLPELLPRPAPTSSMILAAPGWIGIFHRHHRLFNGGLVCIDSFLKGCQKRTPDLAAI